MNRWGKIKNESKQEKKYIRKIEHWSTVTTQNNNEKYTVSVDLVVDIVNSVEFVSDVNYYRDK